MSHSITAKLNQAAREHQNDKGATFFVSLGEKNYNFKTKENEWTNYDAALFAKDNQIQFYRENLIEGCVIEVSATGIVVDASDPNYKPKLMLQDAKLGFINNMGAKPAQQAPQQGGYQQQPQQAPRQQAQGDFTPQPNHQAQPRVQQQGGGYQQQAPQQGGYQNQSERVAPQEPAIDFDDDTPF